jgi:flagellar assembly protein FliH
MSQSRKFLFDNDFAHPEEMARQRAVHTEDELAAAKAEAFEAGRAAMAEEQRVSEEQQTATLVSALTGQIEALLAESTDIENRAVKDAGELAITVCHKILPTLAAQNALTEIEGLVVRTIAEMHEEPRLVVRVADSKLDDLQIRFERMSSAFSGKLVLLGDDELAPTDCAVLWADGGAERDFARLWTEVNLALSGLSDSRTAPEAPSPLAGLPGAESQETTGDSAFADAIPTTPVMTTETANQESGHG